MVGSGLFTLLDDIAVLMDDVVIYSKLAAKKTGAVLGDDLAVNAEQVSGVSAERELPIVAKVAKGSLVNKLILVPLALLLSQYAPFLILPLLFIGGSYLCFEGFEKVWETFFKRNAHLHSQLKAENPISEKEKVRGAIRTDFILSLEVIVIVLGTLTEADFMTRLLVLSVFGLGMTIGVYGLVAGIVKIDDLGLWLIQKQNNISMFFGRFFLAFAPRFMKFLSIAGTIAMFLVGGGIVSHIVPLLDSFSNSLPTIFLLLFQGGIGLLWGSMLMPLVFGFFRLRAAL